MEKKTMCEGCAARDRELAEARAMWGREYQKALERADTAERELAEARRDMLTDLRISQEQWEAQCKRTEAAERALAAFRRSFEGHVYVKNEEFAALCADRRALAACEERLTWTEDEVAVSDAALAEARGLLERWGRPVMERSTALLRETRAFLAARPAPASDGEWVEHPCDCGDDECEGVGVKWTPRADPRPAPPCDCGFPWGGGLTAPKRHANDCATRAEPPAPRCTCPPNSPRFLERHGEHDPACPAAEPRCECAPEIEYGVRRHDYDCPVAAAKRGGGA